MQQQGPQGNMPAAARAEQQTIVGQFVVCSNNHRLSSTCLAAGKQKEPTGSNEGLAQQLSLMQQWKTLIVQDQCLQGHAKFACD